MFAGAPARKGNTYGRGGRHGKKIDTGGWTATIQGFIISRKFVPNWFVSNVVV